MYVGLSTAIVSIGTMLLMGSTNFMDGFTNSMGIKDAFRNILQAYSPAIMVTTLFYVLITAILISWVYYLAILIIDDQVKEKNTNFIELLFKSFSIGTLKLMGLNILFYVFLLAVIIPLVFVFTKISIALIIVLILAFLTFCLRLIIVVPAILIGNMRLSEAISYSFGNMTWGRTFRLLGIIVLAIIITFIVAIVLGLIMMIFRSSYAATQIFNILTQVIIGGISMAFSVTASIALYYRYSNMESNTSDEIRFDDLLIPKQD